MKSELNSRQWALYNLLKSNGDTWATQRDIACELPEYNYDASEDHKKFHDNPVRMQMTADIRKINDSSVIQKIIISGPKGIKLANKEEFDRYIRKEIMAAVRRLMRAKRKAAKGNRDGQMRIVFGSERNTIEAFISSNKAVGERLKQLRDEKKLTLKQVAFLLSTVDEPMLSKLEHGYCMPNEQTLLELADIYDISPEWILTGKHSTSTKTSKNGVLQTAKGGKNA